MYIESECVHIYIRIVVVEAMQRGKVQSHVLWRMLGSRVKGEKSIGA